MRTWQDNAHEYGALTKQGKDVRLALLVACSVRNNGKGGNARTRIGSEKTTMAEFAREALGRDTARERVSRHLQVWERMAQAGAVPSAAEMTPTDAVEFGEVIETVQEEFSAEFARLTGERPTGGRPRDSQPEVAAAIIERRGAEAVVGAMTPTQRQEVAAAIVEQSPVRRHKRAQADARRQIDNSGRPQGEGVVTILEDLIHSEEIERRLNAIIDGLRTGWMDNMPDDVKEEAVQLYKRWITALEWAITLTEGGTITDEALEAWLG